MNFLHPLFIVGSILTAFLSMRALRLFDNEPVIPIHFITIDGLRGYLAFFVFLHHATIWFSYTRNGMWVAPASHLHAHLGQASVALFFMITSFLFFDKMLDCRSRQFDWQQFFVHRFFRLTPLYLTVMLAMLTMVALLSHWSRSEQNVKLWSSILAWLSFTIFGAPIINHINPNVIVAGVTWSLPYEWCFYLTLPVLSLLAGLRPSWTALMATAVSLTIAWWTDMQVIYGRIFVGGLIAAWLVRYSQFQQFCKKRLASVIVCLCFGTATLFPTAFEGRAWVCLCMAFCLIAGGADLFGLLLNKTSRSLGQLAYSIYLLHGILLFSMVNFIIGSYRVAVMSSLAYWSCIQLLIPCLLVLSAATFHYVEQPGIQLGKRLSASWSKRTHSTKHTLAQRSE